MNCRCGRPAIVGFSLCSQCSEEIGQQAFRVHHRNQRLLRVTIAVLLITMVTIGIGAWVLFGSGLIKIISDLYKGAF